MTTITLDQSTADALFALLTISFDPADRWPDTQRAIAAARAQSAALDDVRAQLTPDACRACGRPVVRDSDARGAFLACSACEWAVRL